MPFDINGVPIGIGDTVERIIDREYSFFQERGTCWVISRLGVGMGSNDIVLLGDHNTNRTWNSRYFALVRKANAPPKERKSGFKSFQRTIECRNTHSATSE